MSENNPRQTIIMPFNNGAATLRIDGREADLLDMLRRLSRAYIVKEDLPNHFRIIEIENKPVNEPATIRSNN